MQTVSSLFGDEVRELTLPDPNEEVMPDVKWGHFLDFFTPAYWAAMIWMAGHESEILTYKIGRTLKEEVAACLLGGHGITAEMSFAAYDSLRSEGILTASTVTEEHIFDILARPMSVKNRLVRYRFPRQKASFLAPVLNKLSKETPATIDHRAFRNWFLQFRGIGPKTASWITRNWLDSRSVAILDIHIIRCGRLCGFFKPFHSPQRHYIEMERLYLNFAENICVDAAKLDVLIWQQMRVANRIGMQALANTRN